MAEQAAAAMRMSAAALALLSPVAPLSAQGADAMMARGLALTAARPCAAASADDIVICGSGDRTGRYRLPLPRADDLATTRSSGGNLSAAEVIRTPGECGPSGTRRCTKREAATQGYGGGRDPLTLAARLAGRLLDPDGDTGLPPPR